MTKSRDGRPDELRSKRARSLCRTHFTHSGYEPPSLYVSPQEISDVQVENFCMRHRIETDGVPEFLAYVKGLIERDYRLLKSAPSPSERRSDLARVRNNLIELIVCLRRLPVGDLLSAMKFDAETSNELTSMFPDLLAICEPEQFEELQRSIDPKTVGNPHILSDLFDTARRSLKPATIDALFRAVLCSVQDQLDYLDDKLAEEPTFSKNAPEFEPSRHAVFNLCELYERKTDRQFIENISGERIRATTQCVVFVQDAMAAIGVEFNANRVRAACNHYAQRQHEMAKNPQPTAVFTIRRSE